MTPRRLCSTRQRWVDDTAKYFRWRNGSFATIGGLQSTIIWLPDPGSLAVRLARQIARSW